MLSGSATQICALEGVATYNQQTGRWDPSAAGYKNHIALTGGRQVVYEMNLQLSLKRYNSG